MVHIESGFLLWLALLILVLPWPWLLCFLLAAAVHELGHLGAVTALGGQVWGITLGLGGARIDARLEGCWRELGAVLAGPGASLILALLSRKAPMLCLWALVQGCFNLIPVYPLDGGRAVNCLVRVQREGKPAM